MRKTKTAQEKIDLVNYYLLVVHYYLKLKASHRIKFGKTNKFIGSGTK